MNIKDFKVGQTAYLMNFHDKQSNKDTTTIDEVNVVSVGKKYVKVKRFDFGYEYSFFQWEINDSYLTEKKDYGGKNYLFRTQQDIDEYKERKELLKWIYNKVQRIKENQYSVEQFREIKRILENPKKGK